MYSYEELAIQNRNKCITFISVEPNQSDTTGMSDNIIIKHNEAAENIIGYKNLFNSVYYITNISDVKQYYKRAYKNMALNDAQSIYEQSGVKVKMSRYTRQFETDWNNIVLSNNRKSVKIVGFRKESLKFVTNIPSNYDNAGKICGFAELSIKHYMETGDSGFNNRYITNLSDVKNIIDKLFNIANKKKQEIIARNDKLRNIDANNTAKFDAIKDILSKCAKEYNISAPYSDTGTSYRISHTFRTKGDTFNYETTNTVSISMNPKTIKIRYSFWVDSDNFNNEKVVEKTVPFKRIDSKDKMKKLIEQIIKSLKKESR